MNDGTSLPIGPDHPRAVEHLSPDFARNAQVTDLLCALVALVERQGYAETIDAVPGLRKWWEVHKAQDTLDRARRL